MPQPLSPIEALRELARLAHVAGADPAQIEAVVDTLWMTLQAVDGARLESLLLAREVHQADLNARLAGQPVSASVLAARFGRSRQRIAQILDKRPFVKRGLGSAP